MIVVIEGGDQAGKKTQTELLFKALKKRKIKATTFSLPDYTTPVGKEIAKYLSGKRKFLPQTIHCLLAAKRWEKLNQILQIISNFKKVQGENQLFLDIFAIKSPLVYCLLHFKKYLTDQFCKYFVYLLYLVIVIIMHSLDQVAPT